MDQTQRLKRIQATWKLFLGFALLLGSTGSVFAASLASFDFSTGLHGWTYNSHTVNVNVTNEGVAFDTVQNDPQWVSPPLPFTRGPTYRVVLRLKSDATSGACDLFYGKQFNGNDRIRFQVNTDNQWREYSINLPSLPNRAKLRFDPPSNAHTVWSSIRIEEFSDELALDNGVVRVELDLTAGGAITHISKVGHNENMVNIHDRGRMIQQSYYAGQSLNRQAEGQSPHWSPWSWNPIQVGDAFGNSGKVLEAEIVDEVAYTKTHPLLWDMNNEFGQCHLEQWTRLDDNKIHVRNKITTFRDADDPWTSQHQAPQELPAIYTTGNFACLYTYIGDRPWENQPLTRIINDKHDGFLWDGYTAAEYWAANVTSTGPDAWGLGVFNTGTKKHNGGYTGNPHKRGGGPKDGPTAHIAPIGKRSIGRNDEWEYEYTLIVGTLDEIRQYAYDHRPAWITGEITWLFDSDGDTAGWQANSHVREANVAEGVYTLQIAGNDPQISVSSISLPTSSQTLHLRMKNQTSKNTATLFWANAQGGFGASGHHKSFWVSSQDTDYQEYHINLSTLAGWQGSITQLRFDPPGSSGQVSIDYLAITKSSSFSPGRVRGR